MITRKIHPSALLLLILLAACGRSAPPPTASPSPAAPSATIQPPSATPSPTSTLTPSATPTPPPPTDTPTPTPTPVPTYVVLRGEVIVAQANCRYGPGAPYLYKYGLLAGNRLEIIGRNAPGTWIEIRAIGGSNPCWVKADLMKIQGDVLDVQPIDPLDVRLPQSPYYGPLTGVYAARRGDEVTVSWNPLVLRAGDDSEQFPYLIEAWVCRQGQITFTPVGTYATAAIIADEAGCAEPSHGRVYGVEKHGYTRWVEIPWPPAVPLAATQTP